MTAETLAAAILRDVPRYADAYGNVSRNPAGTYIKLADMFTALSRALGGDDLVERAGAVLEGVTEGPWYVAPHRLLRVYCLEGPRSVVLAGLHRFGKKGGLKTDGTPEANARFIAAARELVPALLARNAALRAELDEARAAHDADQKAYLSAWGRAAAAEAEVARLRGALDRINQWAEAYPLKVFPEPDFDKVREALEAAGLSLDAVSASNMRHIIEGVGRIASAALKGAADDRT